MVHLGKSPLPEEKPGSLASERGEQRDISVGLHMGLHRRRAHNFSELQLHLCYVHKSTTTP